MPAPSPTFKTSPTYNRASTFSRPVSYARPTYYGLDSNVKYFLEVGRAIGETVLTGSQISALNTLVLALKSGGYWDYFFGLYPVIGGTAGWHSLNLKNSPTFTGNLRMVANGTITNSSNGSQGNGTNGYWDTAWSVGYTFPSTNIHISAYSRTSATGSDFIWGSTDFDQQTYFQPNDAGTGLTDSLGGDPVTGAGFGSGYFVSLYNSVDSHKAYRNGSLINTNGTPNYSGAEPSLFFMANNNTDSGTSGYSNRQFSLFSFGLSIPPASQAGLYTIIQAYQTALGRQV